VVASGLVDKLPSEDPAAAATAASLGLYEREARFYSQLAPRTELPLPTYLGVMRYDGRPVGLLLEDLSDHESGDQLAELPTPVLRRLREQLVRLQAPFCADPGLEKTEWLHRRLGVAIPAIVERMERSWAISRDRLTGDFDTEERAQIDRFVAGAGE
jgi:hypothetical protein